MQDIDERPLWKAQKEHAKGIPDPCSYHTDYRGLQLEKEFDVGSRPFRNTEARLFGHRQGGPEYDAPAGSAGASFAIEAGTAQLTSLTVHSSTPGAGAYEAPAERGMGRSFTHDKARGDLGVRPAATDEVHHREEEWDRLEREKDTGSRPFRNTEARFVDIAGEGADCYVLPSLPQGYAAVIEARIPRFPMPRSCRMCLLFAFPAF